MEETAVDVQTDLWWKAHEVELPILVGLKQARSELTWRTIGKISKIRKLTFDDEHSKLFERTVGVAERKVLRSHLGCSDERQSVEGSFGV
jgi:hypothetical protein